MLKGFVLAGIELASMFDVSQIQKYIYANNAGRSAEGYGED